MKASFLNSSLFFLALTFFTACNSGKTEQNTTEQTVINQDSTQQTEALQNTAAIYTCPMHPEVTSDKPGKCPQCGMNLEIAKSEGNQDHADNN